MSISRRAAALVLTSMVVLVTTGVGVAPRPLSAQSPAGAPPAALEFVSQTPWHVGDAPVELRIRVSTDRPADALEVAVALYPRITSRSEFTQTLDGRLRRSALNLQRFPLPSLVAEPTGLITIPLSPPLTRQGVYPVRVELREPSSGDVVSAFTTYLVHIPAPIEGERLAVGLAVPFAAETASKPDGTVPLGNAEVDRLANVATTLDAAEIPFTVLSGGETIDALASATNPAARAVLTSLSAGAPGRLFLPQHYAATRLPALIGAGLSDEADRQSRRGAAVLAAQVAGAEVAPTIWVSQSAIDDASLAYLRRRGITRAVVPESSLEPLSLDITLTQTFELGAGAGRIQAAAADDGLRDHFVSKDGPALGAAHLLADLAVIYFDRPGLTRGVPVIPPEGWPADPTFLSAFLSGLTDSPILTGQTLSSMFSGIPPLAVRGQTQVRRLAPGGTSRSPLTNGPVLRARDRIESMVSVFGPFNPIIDRLDRTLLASQAHDLTAARRLALVRGVGTQIDAVLAQVRMPDRRSITLTAREGEIPVTISSAIPYPIRAALRLRSGSLNFPQGDTVPVELTRSNFTQRVTVRANSSGSFPLRVELVSPDGKLVLAETRVTVRSTAVSGVGVALSIGAAAFLALWWARHHRQRSRRLVPS